MSDTTLRVLRREDGPHLAELTRQNQRFLHGWMPSGDQLPEPDFAASIVADIEAGGTWFGVIEHDDELAGALSLNNIRYGISRCAILGYWVAERFNGQGVATEAVRQALDIAYDQYSLHRLDAFTRVDNYGSQRLLEKNGFERCGLSRGHNFIGGRWWDMTMFQKLAPWDDGTRLTPQG